MKNSYSIRTWAPDDRPREKLMQKGASSLSNAELIAILFGSGSRDESAVELARKVLNSMNNDLEKLGRATLEQLCRFKGVGEAKAVCLLSALELGKRRAQYQPEDKPAFEIYKNNPKEHPEGKSIVDICIPVKPL